MSEDRFKFRCWDSNRNKMLMPDTIDECGKDEWYGGIWSIFRGVLEEVQKDGWILMQSTGLKDKNGKFIYEGDILKRYAGIEVVQWDSEFTGFSPWVEPDGYINPSALEVIGNIYENPELLEAKDDE